MKGMNLPRVEVFFAIALFSIMLVLPNVVFGQSQVAAKSVGFETTTIIEFKNDGNTDIETFRLWLGSDFNFKSFKTESGWTGSKTPEGVLVFKTTTPVKPGESVKFGIKTDNPKPGINWKALDEKENQIEIGKTLVSEAVSPPDETKSEPKSQTPPTNGGILDKSSFRIIPEKPNVGSTIRVTGDNFAANQKLEFYINDLQLQSFQTDSDGRFMITTKIPNNQPTDRVNFVVKDKQGKEKSLSLRLGESQGGRMTTEEVVELVINEFPTVMNRGEVITIKGIGKPGGTVTATVKTPEGNLVTTNATTIDSQGKWTYSTLIPLDLPLGEYSAEISDGKDVIKKTWTVETSQKIQIFPIKLKYEPGEAIKFNGTAIPNQQLELVLEDPIGTEVASDVVNVGVDGFVEFEYKTVKSSVEGTYILFASQGRESNTSLVGLGELPEVKLIAKTDKLNYKAGEQASVNLDGPPRATISLIVIDPSDKNKFSDTVILDQDGKVAYNLDLTGYSTGVYTLVIQRGNSQAQEVFTVGLQTGSGKIDIRTTKTEYLPSQPILILGNTNSNVLVTVSLIDPDGKVVKIKETFTNKEGLLSESSFRIPSDAKAGTWIVRASSGSNFDEEKIQINPTAETGFVVLVDGVTFVPELNKKTVNIRGFGATSTTIVITILDQNDVQVGELNVVKTSSGEFKGAWPAADDLSPGTYKVIAKDASNQAETTFTFS